MAWLIIGGMIFFGDRIAPAQAGFIVLIAIGVMGAKLFAPAEGSLCLS